MPRKPRYYLAGVPCHVILRGHNREPCFATREIFGYYLQCLREACFKHDAAVHAYVLTTNHVHLLMTPAERGRGPTSCSTLWSRHCTSANRSAQIAWSITAIAACRATL
jgi:putative transposase